MVMVSKAAAPSSITHPAHPAHVLELVATGGALFQCDGCRHYGDDERRYRCTPCDFDLHVCCATMEPQLAHPFFEGATLTFLHSPPSAPAKVSAPTTEEVGTPQCAPIRRSGNRFSRFCKVASMVVEITLAVANLDPVGVVTAVADL